MTQSYYSRLLYSDSVTKFSRLQILYSTLFIRCVFGSIFREEP